MPQPTRLRFVEERSRRPLAGYEVRVTTPGREDERVVGCTDREGRIAVAADRAGVVLVHLRSGRETLVRLPVLPGLASDPQEVPIRADPARLLVEGRVVALQESLADEAARRAILTRRIESLAERQAWNEADEALERLKRPVHEEFHSRLSEIRAYALGQEQKGPSDALSPRTQKLLAETEKLIDQYLSPAGVRELAAELQKRKQKQRAAANP